MAGSSTDHAKRLAQYVRYNASEKGKAREARRPDRRTYFTAYDRAHEGVPYGPRGFISRTLQRSGKRAAIATKRLNQRGYHLDPIAPYQTRTNPVVSAEVLLDALEEIGWVSRIVPA